jgi:hypothetical protein
MIFQKERITMSDHSKPMSHAQVEKLLAKTFPPPNSLCPHLCSEYSYYSDLYEQAVNDNDAAYAKRYLILLSALSRQIAADKCECHPE